ncbi:MAG TPA: hypothetical protein VG204_20705 [Terriglobia bacterium]|nr:hypothetical protein [Terriglobia bacterium]
MKWFPSRRLRLRHLLVALPPVCLCVVGLVARGEMDEWIQNIEGSGRFEAVFFRAAPTPGGPITVRRPTAESRNALNELVAKAPSDVELLLMRARVDEEQLDFDAAEADWKKRAELLSDKPAGQLELADFYHRRLRPVDEVTALEQVGRSASSPADRLLPAIEQRSWHAFERIFSVINAQALPPTLGAEEYRAWMARYPKESQVYSRFFDFLLDHKQFAAAERLIPTYEKAFPDDKVFPVEARAWLEYRRGSAESALALYDHSFQPLWPPDLVQAYFSLLKDTHHLRDFLDAARAAVKAHPEDVNAASRLFYYYQQQGNIPEAERALLEYRLRIERNRGAWTAEQLWTLGQLFEGIHNYNEGARCYYALYSLPGVEPAFAEKALAAIINVLLSAPELSIPFGSQDLSLLRDIGTLDAYPGFLNGILSLLLNSQQPANHYAQAEGVSVAYFHRARAAELLPLFDSRFPQSPVRLELHAKVLEVYSTYGADDAVIRNAHEFLGSFPKAPQRVHVALLLADALARKGRVKEELAVYDKLLAELAARAHHVPLGEQAASAYPVGTVRPSYPTAQVETPSTQEDVAEGGTPPGAGAVPVPRPSVRQSRSGGARSPEYSSVLERYISRLVALKKPLQVLSLLQREIARNPNDPGLYERLATFLDQNRLGEQVDEVYRQAIKQFPNRTWYEKLARWYLRRRRTADFEKLSGEVVDIFSGSDLQKYFEDVVAPGGIDAQWYLQVNRYAHARFPHNLAFVNNLLNAYSRPETANAAEWEAMMRQYWYYDDSLRSRYFAYLSSGHRLDAELEALRQTNPAAASNHWVEVANANPAAAQFISEAELWRSHFEAAAPVTRAVAEVYPGDDARNSRAVSVFRSLAAFHPEDTQIAASLEENLSKRAPRDRATLTRIGEIYADREMFDQSRPYWNRIAELEPGDASGYLDAATVFWDYFLFNDTLRLIHLGRRKLAQPSLFAYEAGAVYENQRNYPKAIQEYVQGALAAGDQSPARTRLLQLAKRPKLGPLVEQATAKLVAAPNPDWTAASLRIAVLETLGRRDDLEKLLVSLAANTTSPELLERLDPVAIEQGFDAVHTQMLEQRAALSTDPVERLRLRLDLARFEEAKGNVDEARRLIESIHEENHTVLEVVRATTDFYWRNKFWDPAIDTLLEASKAAYRDLSRQFTFEACRKATDAKEYQRARDLLGPLLAGDPYNAEYLAAMADTYAREGNDQALRDFYLAKIQAFHGAPFSTDERNQRIAALRRGLIPALSRLKDYAGATAQYIEILNRYPEDEGLAQEAAAYADHHGRRQQLLSYYAKAVTDSPKDFRWPMVLARLQTYFEDYPAAIASYSKAQQVRPDRSDLLVARATLEERLMRFDEAIQTYTRIYGLTYQNPQWMEKVAELRARQGQVDAAVEALRRAMIEGRPERPAIFFNAAARLEAWNMLPQAREFAERGVSLAGPALVTDPEYLAGARTYATILTRLRGYEAAFSRLESAAQAAQHARFTPDLQTPLQAMGAAVKTYFTPEEKIAFAGFLEKKREGESEEHLTQTLLPVVETAGLADLEARWRDELMMAHPGSPEAQVQEARLEQLQKQRMRFNELGAQLESYWNVYPPVVGKDSILERAALSYQAAGNTEAELRALSQAFNHQGLSDVALHRYLDLLLASDPQRLGIIAGDGAVGPVKDAAANTAVSGGDAKLALAVIAARGHGLPPVWTRAYTGLVGLYYADPAAEIGAAYQAALGTGTIGDRVGKSVDRDQQLAGNIWFYYGSRYGEYLAVTRQGNPEDFLPAILEGTPASPDAYTTLAEHYRDAGEFDRALADYAHTLELAPQHGEILDHMASILWQQGKHEDAIQRWRAAFQAFLREEDNRRVPPSFWEDVRTTLEHVGERNLLPQVREDADKVLRTYVHRNGTYRVDSLLAGAMAAQSDPAAGAAWIIDLAGAAPNPLSFLSGIADARWIPTPQREPILRRILQLAEDEAAQAHGAAQGVALEALRNWQMRRVSYLLDAHRTQEAQTAFLAIPEELRKQHLQGVTTLEIRISAQSGTLDATLARYDAEPDNAPPLGVLQSAAADLEREHDQSSARRVLEFVYTREIDAHNLTPANFLGLAEIRLQSGDSERGVALLRRMALVAGEPFENLNAAAELLLKYGHAAEATEFLSARVKAVPWDDQARVELAKTEIAAHHGSTSTSLSSVAASSLASYSTRAAAAEALALARAQGASLGSGELDLLAKGRAQDATAAEQPGYFYARIQAAERVGDPATRVRLLLGAVAIQPLDESTRVPLFRAAVAAGQDQLAYSAIQPLLNEGYAGSYQYPSRFRNAEGTEPAEEEVYANPSESVEFLPRIKLSAEEKPALAAQVAEVLEKLHWLSEAARYWTIAVALAPAGPSHDEFQSRLRKVKAQIRLEQRDVARRPVVTEHLEQKVTVRPRLATTPGIADAPAQDGGGGR